MPVDPRMFAPFNLGELLRNQEQIRGSQSDRAYREHLIQRQTADAEREAAGREALGGFITGAPAATLGDMIPPPQAAMAAAIRAGADPAQVLAAHRALRGDTPTPTSLQRDYEFMESIQPGLGRQMLEGRADPLVQMDVTGDGIPDIAPRSAVMGRVRAAPAGNLDATPTSEDGYDYTPGPGGRANPQNWRRQGGQAGQAPAPFNPASVNANFSSGRRTAEGNRLVGGVPNSRHLTGEAADFTPRGGETMGQLYNRLRRQFPNARVINEGDHVHVQQSGWNVPYHGRRGTAGLRGR